MSEQSSPDTEAILQLIDSKFERELETLHLRLDHLDLALDLILEKLGGTLQKYTVVEMSPGEEKVLRRQQDPAVTQERKAA